MAFMDDVCVWTSGHQASRPGVTPQAQAGSLSGYDDTVHRVPIMGRVRWGHTTKHDKERSRCLFSRKLKDVVVDELLYKKCPVEPTSLSYGERDGKN